MKIILNPNYDLAIITLKDCGYDLQRVFLKVIRSFNEGTSVRIVVESEYLEYLFLPKSRTKVTVQDEEITGRIGKLAEKMDSARFVFILKALVNASIVVTGLGSGVKSADFSQTYISNKCGKSENKAAKSRRPKIPDKPSRIAGHHYIESKDFLIDVNDYADDPCRFLSDRIDAGGYGSVTEKLVKTYERVNGYMADVATAKENNAPFDIEEAEKRKPPRVSLDEIIRKAFEAGKEKSSKSENPHSEAAIQTAQDVILNLINPEANMEAAKKFTHKENT